MTRSPTWFVPLCVLLSLAMGAGSPTARADDQGASAADQTAAAAAAATIDVSKFRLTWSEEFDALDVSAWGTRADGVRTKWIAHTPWNGDFGDARFANPTPSFPFSVVKGVLRIEARKDSPPPTDANSRRWSAGLLASSDAKGNGFGQRYGYFEMRAKLPAGRGVWPAFWLATHRDYTDPKAALDGRIEIDVLEYYGHNSAAFHAAVHVWSPKPHRAITQKIPIPAGAAEAGFHTYGVMVEPRTISVYFDRVRVWVTGTPAEHKYPLIVLLNLALGGGWPIDKTPSPSFMYVDYVRVYEDPALSAAAAEAAP